MGYDLTHTTFETCKIKRSTLGVYIHTQETPASTNLFITIETHPLTADTYPMLSSPHSVTVDTHPHHHHHLSSHHDLLHDRDSHLSTAADYHHHRTTSPVHHRPANYPSHLSRAWNEDSATSSAASTGRNQIYRDTHYHPKYAYSLYRFRFQYGYCRGRRDGQVHVDEPSCRRCRRKAGDGRRGRGF